MLDINGIIEVLNNKDKFYTPMLMRWREVYWGLSLHIDGACPAYRDLTYNGWTYPPNYFGREYDYIFNLRLLNKHPRESDATRNWRLSQYKPFTQAPFLQVIEVVTGAIFQDSGYSITVDDKDDNDYIWGNNFDGKTLTGFISEKFKNICEDPNGVFVTMPKEPYYATTTKNIEPHIYFIQSKSIVHITDDEIIFGHGDYMWAVNGIGYFRFTKQDDKYIHVDAQYGGYYAHLMGSMPIIKAGGIWNTQGFYDSWLHAAKPIADEFVSAKSAEQLVNKEASHPFIVEPSTDCPSCRGVGVVQWCPTCNCLPVNCQCDNVNNYNAYVQHNCDGCGGSGQKSQNPGDRLVVPEENLKNAQIQIISPDTKINDFHAKNNADLYLQMMKALNLHYIDQAQSGVAKDKDMETRYQFILRISNDLFDRVIGGIIEGMLSLRNVRSANGQLKPVTGTYTIVKPTQFQIKTSLDLLAEYKEATVSLIPDYQKAELLIDYVDKQFGGNAALKRKTYLVNQMDIFAVKTEGDISIALLNNGASTRDYQFHIQLPKIIDKLLREKGDEWLLGSEYDVIEKDVKSIFDAMKPPIPDLQPTNINERLNVSQ